MSDTGSRLTRRALVQGVGALGAGAALGVAGRPALASTGSAKPEVLSGNSFDLVIGRQTINKTGSQS